MGRTFGCGRMMRICHDTIIVFIANCINTTKYMDSRAVMNAINGCYSFSPAEGLGIVSDQFVF